MDESLNYRMRRCTACGGTGFVKVRSRDDYKDTDQMDPHELHAIVQNAIRSSPPLPPASPVFTAEPPTMPDDDWVTRHLARRRKRDRHVVLGLLLAFLLGAAFALGRFL